MMFSELIRQLMLARQLNFSEGRFEMLGIRGVVIPAFTLTKFIEKLYQVEGEDAFTTLFDIGQAHGQLGVEQIGEKHGMQKFDFLEKIIESGNIMGLGKAELKRFNKEKGEVIITLTDSPFKDEFSNSSVLQDIEPPIDHFQRGVFHTMVSAILDKPVESTEETCSFGQHAHCRFRFTTV